MLRVPADITNQPEKVQSARKEAVRALCFYCQQEIREMATSPETKCLTCDRVIRDKRPDLARRELMRQCSKRDQCRFAYETA
jgi:hypothetical protein